MRWFLRYLEGFVKLNISGEYAEILINKATKNGIILWDLYYFENSISGYISIKDFKYLYLIRKKARAKVKIIKKIGLSFIIYRYRKRVGFLTGAALFFVLLQFLSLFVWNVQVVGNTTVKSQEILDDCRKTGIYEGVKKSKINPKNTADRILLLNGKLAWCSVNIEGCVVTVNVTETKNINDENEKVPSNLIAKEDGIIKKIDVKSGNTAVKVGDAVAKGDVLVSGIVEGIGSTVFVRSSGTVKAEIQKEFKEKSDFVVTESYFTGKIKKQSVLEIFGIKIPLYFKRPQGEYILEKNYKKVFVNKKSLPFAKSENIYRYIEKVPVKKSEEQIKVDLKKKVLEKIEKYGDKNYEIKSEEYIVSQDGIELKITAVILCDIASEKRIKVSAE